MSKIQVNEIVNHFDNGAPDCPKGLTVTGFTTFSGSVSVGGTLTYEDVTNVESIGVATFRDDVNIGVGGTVAFFDVSTGNIGINTTSITFGKLQVTQSSDTDEGGIGIVDSTISRSLRLYCTSSNAVLNSGNGGSGTLILNEGTGRIGIGTDDPTAGTDGESDDLVIHRASGAAGMTIKTASNATGAIRFADTDGASQGRIEYNHPSDYLRWNTGGSEKLRIDSSGNLSLAADTDTYIGHPASDTLTVTTGGTERMRITNVGEARFFASGATLIAARNTASAGTSVTNIAGVFGSTDNTNGTVSFRVYTNGNVQNTNDSYGQLSDIKLKENIVDATSQWDDFKAVRFRKFNFKEETGHETFTQLGVIAQELELVSPGLVYETPDLDEEGNDLGTTTKAVKSSILVKKAMVALQEAMERIETLEAKVTTLEGA